MTYCLVFKIRKDKKKKRKQRGPTDEFNRRVEYVTACVQAKIDAHDRVPLFFDDRDFERRCIAASDEEE